MVLKLDIVDRRILYQLDVNSRQSNSSIGKKINSSKQVVGFRLKRFIEKNIISFHTVIDISKLGFTIHKNFLRLQNINQQKEAEIINYLKIHPHVVWVASCDGMFDLAFGTWARDMAFLDKTLREITKQFGDYIRERQIATIIRGEYFIRNYLVESERKQARESFFGSVPENVSLDNIDWNIIHSIASNARVTAVELGTKISLSPDAVVRRIKKLEKSGIIRHYNITPNESLYPFIHYKVLISFRNISEEREQSIITYCRSHKNIVYIVKALGPWDFEIDIEVASQDIFRKMMMEIKTKFSDIIKDYSTLHIYQVHKYNFCPSIPE